MSGNAKRRRKAVDDSKARQTLARLCPSWDVDAIWEIVTAIKDNAPVASPGDWLEIPCFFPTGFSLVALEFDGEGNVLVSPSTFCSTIGRELWRVLLLVLEDRCWLGEWRDGNPVIAAKGQTWLGPIPGGAQ